MTDSLWAFFTDPNYGSAASVLGVILSVAGFTVTIWNIQRSKRAADLARKAAESAREEIRRTNTIADFSSAISIIEEIRRLQREQAWRALPDRYTSLIRILLAVLSSELNLNDEEKNAIRTAIQHFRTIEYRIDELLQDDGAVLNIAKINAVLMLQISRIIPILESLKSRRRHDAY